MMSLGAASMVCIDSNSPIFSLLKYKVYVIRAILRAALDNEAICSLFMNKIGLALFNSMPEKRFFSRIQR